MINPHTHVLVILNIAHNIHFINQVNVSAQGISYAGAMWITISMYIPSLHINSVNLQLGKGNIIFSIVSSVRISSGLKSQSSILCAVFKVL